MIGDERKQKYDLLDGITDKLTFYINPEIYVKEQHIKEHGSLPGQMVNSEFTRHSESAKKHGKPDPSPVMKKAFEQIYNKERTRDNIVFLMGKDGTVTNGSIGPSSEIKQLCKVIPSEQNDDDDPFLG